MDRASLSSGSRSSSLGYKVSINVCPGKYRMKRDPRMYLMYM